MIIDKDPNKNEPKKLKSWPLFAAKNVYRVKPNIIAVVNMIMSRITFPAPNFQPC
jgi:hypothetical protein